MIHLALSEITAALENARLVGDDCVIHGLTTDSRASCEDALFVALKGERFDGHDYVVSAMDQGAAAVVVERPLDLDIPQLLVADSRLALGAIAGLWRRRVPAQVVALTGSNGKTTLKEMLAAIFALEGPVLATQGNLNNDIGVPLTLARLGDEPRAVIELGANHPGEIDYLTRLAQPDVAILSNAGRAHLEGFGSLEGVARAKAEIINGLSDDGVFVYPADSQWSSLWRQLAGERLTQTFATEGSADVTSVEPETLQWDDAGFRQVFDVTLTSGSVTVELALAGMHNRRNALAAMTAAHAMGIEPESMARGLAGLAPVPGRLYPVAARNGLRLIDDSYNANPDSVTAAMAVLRTAPGRRFLVLGDLAELGDEGGQMHADLGAKAKELGLDGLFTLGSESRLAADAFGSGGAHFAELNALLSFLDERLSPGDTLLVKGSRAARMERVVDAFATPAGGDDKTHLKARDMNERSIAC